MGCEYFGLEASGGLMREPEKRLGQKRLRNDTASFFLAVLLLPLACVSQGQAPPLAVRSEVVTGLRAAAIPLRGQPKDYDALMALVREARLVLLGEATHGTHEFYRERIRITQRLIQEKGFTVIVIEGDWPDAYRVNQYVQGLGRDASAEQALANFTRFPHWMWRNTDVRDLVQWLRQYNSALPIATFSATPRGTTPRVEFHGMDVYSLPRSLELVVQHLEQVDPQAARRARERYRCFDRFRNDPDAYGLAALRQPSGSCAAVAAEEFQELQRLYQKAQQQGTPQSMPEGTPQSAGGANAQVKRTHELFAALQNARIVKNAEQYYRVMYEGTTSSWNLRDQHMAETLDALATHLRAQLEVRPGAPPRAPTVPVKMVVWAHNSHVGDVRSTTMGESGEWTLGQLMRQRAKDQVVLVGFTTYQGTVMAATAWGQEGKVERVRPALPGSFASLFHETGIGSFLLPLQGESQLALAMGEPRLERAIGVIYLPQTERESHYFQARMSKQFDAVIHLDTTTAVKPLRH